MTIDGIDSEELTLELPSWRPGRYELGNFAKNIRSWKAYNDKNEILAFRKISKDTWQISTDGSSKVIVKYEYYANQPDAGACYIDENQVYINPIHCFFYVQGLLHESTILELNLPKNYKVACSLEKKSEHVLLASDFHELYDSPFIAGDSMQVEKYEVEGVEFYIWLQGNCEPDWTKIIDDFKAFTIDQHKMMGSFPFDTYHFLVQVLPYPFYHGVEHLKSTVLGIGPGYDLMNNNVYIDFIGVASHELFHAWNVKTIRPAEMMPYNYKKENYSRLGFVYEGLTTYYGDLILARCGVYNSEQFFKELNVRIQKHFDNPGRHNLSVADSSFDTWLDGYTPGIPGRKTSIYDEGCITALMTDLLIRKKTNSKASLDDVMLTLYEDFGKKNIGYTEHDYFSVVEFIAKQSMADFLLDHVYGTEDDEALLSEVLSFAGCELRKSPSHVQTENYFGFKTSVESGNTVAGAIVGGSPASEAGLGIGDMIVAVNEIRVEENIDALLKMFAGKKIVLTILTPMKMLKDIAVAPSQKQFFAKYAIVKSSNPSAEKKEFYNTWLKQEFEDKLKVATA